MTRNPRYLRATGAPAGVLVLFLALFPTVGPASGWSEFGAEEDEKLSAEGPEIREPFFAFLVAVAEGDSPGTWSGADLLARAAAAGHTSRFPLDLVREVSRARPDTVRADRYGVPLRALWTIRLTAPLDRPMPYSILGYHPGSLRLAADLELAELAAMNLVLPVAGGGVPVREMRVFALERGHVVLDADGWLDALLGSGLDDSWTLGFVTARTAAGLVGLGVSLGRDGRRIYGEFDFRGDKVLPHGRPLSSALSRASRTWLNVDDGNLPPSWRE